MRRISPGGWVLLVALVLAVSGCKPHLYRAETVLNSDGSIRRAIYQPVATTPEAAIQRENWSGVTYAPRIDDADWRGPIAELPAAERDKTHDYFAAWADFAAPNFMPQTFVKPAPGGLPSGVLAIDYERTDLVFVVEHDWRETLTDVVTLDDMHLARRELADLLLPVAEQTLVEGFGPEYDVSGLVDWLKNTGTPLAFEMADVFFVVRLQGRDSSSEVLVRNLEPVLARRGFKLRDAEGNLLSDEKLEAAIKEFAVGTVRDNVRRKDGKPVPQAKIEELFGSLGEPQDEAAEPRQPNPFAEALERAIREKFGSEEEFQEAFAPLAVRILGLYRSEIVGPARRFDYTMQMPGPIVESSGELLADNRTRFRFEAGQAYPAGYVMHCRSLENQTELEKQVFGKQVLDDREKMLRFVEIARGSATVLDALRQCAEEKSVKPLVEARDRTAPGSPDTAAFDAMIGLLGVK